ncbi:MAG: hypothetical protein NTZ44_01270 [Candidatus Nomurabacteria bacterium]|nr:hypothetical protein [Candidatus Nomurabacteria bacterium]
MSYNDELKDDEELEVELKDMDLENLGDEESEFGGYGIPDDES